MQVMMYIMENVKFYLENSKYSLLFLYKYYN